VGEAGNEETAEFRVLDAPTQQLPALIPAMAHVPTDVTAHGPGLARRWRLTLLALAAAALASIPLALFTTSDGTSQHEQMPPLRWPPAAAAASESPTPEPYSTEDPEAPPAGPPLAAGEAAPPRTGATPTASTGPSPTAPAPGSYEAEAPGNRLRGRAAPRPVAGASGGSVVGWVGDDRDNTLTFTGVRATKAGQYRVTIHYVTQERRAAVVEVNGRRSTVVDFPSTGGWDKVGSTTITLTLRPGENTIEFSNRYAWAPDFDRIVLPG